MEDVKEQTKFKLPVIPLVVTLMFLLGAGVFLYPTVSNYFAEKNSTQKSDEYLNSISKLTEDTLAREKQKAIDYNNALAGDPVKDPFIEGSGMALPTNYTSVLNINDTICTVEIPKIHVKLPVYHGTSKHVLDVAVGHIRQTAFPIGGEGYHSVLTGHTGLSSAKLFTDLVKMKLDDMFIIYVLDETHYYKVDDISIIVPEDIENLEPIHGKDYITLVTCTPYGVNSHRLLVRGVRIEPNEKEVENILNVQRNLWEVIWEYKAIFIVILFVLILIIAWILYLLNKRKKQSSEI